MSFQSANVFTILVGNQLVLKNKRYPHPPFSKYEYKTTEGVSVQVSNDTEIFTFPKEGLYKIDVVEHDIVRGQLISRLTAKFITVRANL